MKTELTQLQKLLLCSAAGRESGALLPADAVGEDDKHVRSAARGLMARGFVIVTEVVGAEYVWKADGDTPLGYLITDAGLAAVEKSLSAQVLAQTGCEPPYPFFVDEPEPAPLERASPKQDLLISMLMRTEGATIAQISAAAKWLPHTVRAALTNLRRQKYLISSEKPNGVRIYRAIAKEVQQ